LTGRVVDQPGIMTAQRRSELEAKLKDLEDKSGNGCGFSLFLPL
jgi:uncharacterized membrane protein YgcG